MAALGNISKGLQLQIQTQLLESESQSQLMSYKCESW